MKKRLLLAKMARFYKKKEIGLKGAADNKAVFTKAVPTTGIGYIKQ